MRCPVSFEGRGSAQDSVGQQSTTWTTLGTAMAAIEPIRGREYYIASGDKADVTHEVRLRALPMFLKPRDRMKYGTRIFDIKSVIDVSERDREWLLMCVEALHTNG